MSSPFYPYPSPQSLPSPLSNLLPSIAQQTSGLALTPNTNPFLGLAPPQPGPSLSTGGSVRSNIRRDEVTLEDTLRGLEEAGVLIERARVLLEEIGRVQASVFSGEVGRLDLLQIEYNQIINTLYTLAISSSFGALPLTPPTSLSNGADQSTIPMDTPELIAWCETRAGLEFSRREGGKNGSKAVLDILKAR